MRHGERGETLGMENRATLGMLTQLLFSNVKIETLNHRVQDGLGQRLANDIAVLNANNRS